MLEELRIQRRSGVIDEAVLELGARLHRGHRRDRCGQDHGGDRSGAAVRRPRRPGAGPHRRRQGRGRGPLLRRPTRRPRRPRSRSSAARSTTASVLFARRSPPRAARGPTLGGASVPVGSARRRWPTRWSRCTASPTSTGCSAGRQRDALDRFAGDAGRRRCGAYEQAYDGSGRPRARARRPSRRSARERAREADLLRLGLAEIEAVDPQPGEDAGSRGGARLGHADALRTAAEQAHEALPAIRRPGRRRDWPRAGGGARTALEACASTTRSSPGSPTGWPRRPTWSPTSPPTWPPTPRAWTPTRPGWRRSQERRAALTALTRKYGEDDRRGARLGRKPPPQRLLELDDTDDADRRAARPRATSCARARPVSPRRLGRPATTPPRLGDEVTAELAGWRCRTPRVDGRRGHGTTTADGLGGRRARGALRPRRRRRRRAAAGGRSGAPRSGRWTRAPRAASCPG